MNRLLLVTPEFDFGDIRHEHILTPQQLRDFLEFRIAVARTVKRDEHAKHIAKIVIHERRTRHGRQLPLDVIDLASQLIPDLRQCIPAVLILDSDRHRRQSAFGPGFDLLDL